MTPLMLHQTGLKLTGTAVAHGRFHGHGNLELRTKSHHLCHTGLESNSQGQRWLMGDFTAMGT